MTRNGIPRSWLRHCWVATKLQPSDACAAALDAGSGFSGLLDAVALAASHRMLHHDLTFERVPGVDGHGWLNLTHSLTYANAARWAFADRPR